MTEITHTQLLEAKERIKELVDEMMDDMIALSLGVDHARDILWMLDELRTPGGLSLFPEELALFRKWLDSQEASEDFVLLTIEKA